MSVLLAYFIKGELDLINSDSPPTACDSCVECPISTPRSALWQRKHGTGSSVVNTLPYSSLYCLSLFRITNGGAAQSKPLSSVKSFMIERETTPLVQRWYTWPYIASAKFHPTIQDCASLHLHSRSHHLHQLLSHRPCGLRMQ
jgi:hypothetical protein